MKMERIAPVLEASRIAGSVQPLTFEFFNKQLRCNWNLNVTVRAYLFFFSLFCFRFSFGVSRAFFWCSFLPLSLLPLSPISVSP